MSNVFATAPKVAAKPKAKKADTSDRVLIAGLEELASIDAAMKSLKAMKDTVEAEVKMHQKAHFVEAGLAAGKRPANFKGYEGIAVASCELRARSSASPLSEEEQALLEEHGIPVTKVDTTVETFIINPQYLNDSALLEKVGNVIGKIKDLPADFIMKQEAVSKYIVAEDGLDKLFALPLEKGNPDLAAANRANLVSTLIPIVGTLAIKPTIGDKMKEAMEYVIALLNVKA